MGIFPGELREHGAQGGQAGAVDAGLPGLPQRLQKKTFEFQFPPALEIEQG